MLFLPLPGKLPFNANQLGIWFVASDKRTQLNKKADFHGAASLQFLNVIESVFSGPAKSVIRNSDYESVADCKEAIDAHFGKGNAHFLENPSHAGKKIWGGERVKAVFDKANLCKLPSSRKI